MQEKRQKCAQTFINLALRGWA